MRAKILSFIKCSRSLVHPNDSVLAFQLNLQTKRYFPVKKNVVYDKPKVVEYHRNE